MTTFNLGLLGHPIKASFSPQLHRAAFKDSGLQGDYQLYPIPPDNPEALAEMLARVRKGELQGLNVTIPHKQAVIPLLDKLSETANAIGAVNTISMKNRQLFGDNTDAQGFLNDLVHLSEKTSSVRKALILGAGGSARAVTYALLSEGWEVIIAARRPDQAQALKNYFSSNIEQLSALKLDIHGLADLSSTLIVNTTPVGMLSHLQGSPWPEDLPLPGGTVLYDLIYTPTKTQLMADAEVAGLPIRGGIGMLIEQAALSFQIWTGLKPSTQKMHHAYLDAS
ncbi:MAG: shikimate dehydrogenase [Anaerolineae bacterium]|nr:shikimate dehydrogenase [Anaerolineae bacterium]